MYSNVRNDNDPRKDITIEEAKNDTKNTTPILEKSTLRFGLEASLTDTGKIKTNDSDNVDSILDEMFGTKGGTLDLPRSFSPDFSEEETVENIIRFPLPVLPSFPVTVLSS